MSSKPATSIKITQMPTSALQQAKLSSSPPQNSIFFSMPSASSPSGSTNKTSAMKKLSIARAPKSLCLHIRRLIGMESYVKINFHIDFPLELDLAPFCSFAGEIATDELLKSFMNESEEKDVDPARKSSSLRGDNNARSSTNTTFNSSIVGGQDGYYAVKQNNTCEFPKREMRPRADSASKTSQLLYQLVSVIVHHGDQSGGHYTVYRKLLAEPFSSEKQYEQFVKASFDEKAFPYDSKDSTKNWVHISDEFSRRVSVDEVLQSQAYMLYYEKCEQLKVQ